MNSAFDDLKKRGGNLLRTGKNSDCSFLVGTDDNKRTIAAHKQILAIGSPVFESMFYGDLADNDDPIEIDDIQADAFLAMLEYIYAHKISIENFDRACSLCYLSEKYMLPNLLKSCMKYIMDNLRDSTVCRAYELGKLLNKSELTAKSMELIVRETRKVILDPCFVDIEPSTLLDILNEDSLNVTELELFNALLNYGNEAIDSGQSSKLALFTNLPFFKAKPEGINKNSKVNREPIMRQAVKKIAFLAMTPKDFADVVAGSNLLTLEEEHSILLKIISPANKRHSMPDGFATESLDRDSRPRRFCSRHGAYKCTFDKCTD